MSSSNASTRGTDRGVVQHRRDAMGYGLAVLNRLAGLPAIDRLGIRRQTENAVYLGTRTGFRAVGAASRAFSRSKTGGTPVRTSRSASGTFDLSLTDDQEMIVGVVRELAAEVVRPAAEKADGACETPDEILEQAVELGLPLLEVPDELGGLDDQRSATTGVLVGEALAHGDMGIALACLAPASVATALALWGDADQQQTYLPAFTGQQVPTAALALSEPVALFDPFAPTTTARRVAGGYRLSGTKSAVVRADRAELFVVGADLAGTGPVLFVVESGTAGVTIESDPSMGVRAAGLARLELDDVVVPEHALLGRVSGDGTGESDGTDAYRECVRLSRIAWAGLAVGTSQAVLDYVIPYVKERKAFGQPIASRQSVAFKVADIGIELEGMRLATYRAASRADQGLDFAREAAIARRLTGEYGMRIGQDGVQLLGGHGFVKEHPVERWYRDLRAVGVMEGCLLV